MFHFHKFTFVKKNSCEYCGKNFKTLEQVMHHFQISHDNQIYECKTCNVKVEGMERMRDHVKKNHRYRKKTDEPFA